MKKKISLLMALIMLLGCFSMLTFPTSADTEYTYLVENTNYKKGYNWLGTKPVNSSNPFSGKLETDTNGKANFMGWTMVDGGISGYKYSVDGGELVDVTVGGDELALFNPGGVSSIATSLGISDVNTACNTCGYTFTLDLSGYGAGKSHSINIYAVTAKDSTKLCQVLYSTFTTPYFGYYKAAKQAIEDKYVVYDCDPANNGTDPRGTGQVMTAAYGLSTEKTVFYYGGTSPMRRIYQPVPLSKAGDIVITYLTAKNFNTAAYFGLYKWDNSALIADHLKSDNLTTNQAPIAYRYNWASTERTAIIKNDPKTAYDGSNILVRLNATSSVVLLVSRIVFYTDYEAYCAEISALDAKMAAADASVGSAVKACDGLEFWAKDAASAQAKLDSVVKAKLNNETVSVSYANGAIADGKYTVDVTYAIEGASYTDKVEVAVSDKAVVGAQSRSNGDDTYSVRFLATIDDYTAYDEIGFEIVADYEAGAYAETGKTYDVKCYEVFDSVLSLEDKTTVTNKAGDFHGNYLMALTIDGIPTNTGAAGFTVRAYYVAKGTTERIYTDSVSFNAIGGALVNN